MASPYATPVAWVDETGLHVPAFADVLAYFQGAYRGIYGSDIYLGNDSQDGQWVGLLASAVNDMNAAYAANYQDRSPASAQGEALSSLVKINGLSRAVATNSTVDLLIVGQVGTEIDNGIATDAASANWILPASVVIPASGQITVTATAADVGATAAPANTITTILTVTRGWQSVTNPAAAVIGQPVERDPRLKARQRISTAIPSTSLYEGLAAAIVALPNVVELRGYENDSGVTDANGIPGHCISLVIDGGDAQTLGNIIRAKKGPGVGTYGDVAVETVDAYGIGRTIRFFRPTSVPIAFYITIKALSGFTLATQDLIAEAVSTWTNALAIGEPLRLTRAYVPANLSGAAISGTYEILTVVATRDGAAPGFPTDVVLAFNEVATCLPENVQFTVTT